MQLLNEFIDKEIDKQGENLIKKYNKVPRDELLKYKNPELEAVPPDYGVSKKIDQIIETYTQNWGISYGKKKDGTQG